MAMAQAVVDAHSVVETDKNHETQSSHHHHHHYDQDRAKQQPPQEDQANEPAETGGRQGEKPQQQEEKNIPEEQSHHHHNHEQQQQQQQQQQHVVRRPHQQRPRDADSPEKTTTPSRKYHHHQQQQQQQHRVVNAKQGSDLDKTAKKTTIGRSGDTGDDNDDDGGAGDDASEDDDFVRVQDETPVSKKEAGGSSEQVKNNNNQDDDDDHFDDNNKSSVMGVIELDARTFSSSISDGNVWLIEFYSPFCSHCNVFAPTYAAIANHLHKDPTQKLRVARINGQEQRALATRFGLYGFPSFFLIDGWKVYPFEGPRTRRDLLAFCQGGYKNTEKLPFYLSPMGPMGQLQGLLITTGLVVADAFVYTQDRFGLSTLFTAMLVFGSAFCACFVAIVVLAVVWTPKVKEE